ncbi:cation:proton antiporter [Thermus tengchongensis]|uniref:cation:proton antiporter n=1 Tax=Thermus tengchongensis TaxID=1214928 RepID=UPI0023EF4DC6|nr:cation:proton antiporter [Thermus tengchongensis]
MDWSVAAIWMALAVVAALFAIWFRISVALTEILVGVLAGALLGKETLHTNAAWVGFLAGVGSVVLTFLAGAELDPETLRRSWKEAFGIGLAGFFAPFLGAAWLAHVLLGWDARASWLAGVALSTTSVAVVYAVMLELGLNQTPFGKVILAACFVNDLGTVLALGLLFAPFGPATLVFAVGLALGLYLLARVTPALFHRYGGAPTSWRPSSCSWSSSPWGPWRCGAVRRRSCPPTWWAWSWRAPWARTTGSSGGCAP